MKKILVCTNYRVNPNNPSCATRGSEKILSDLTLFLRQNSLEIDIEESPCLGFCQAGPNVRLIPNGPFLHTVSSEKLDEVLKAVKQFIA